MIIKTYVLKNMFGEVYGVGWGGGWRVRGMIEISVTVRTLINYQFQNDACKEMMLVRNELLKFLNIISKLL